MKDLNKRIIMLYNSLFLMFLGYNVFYASYHLVVWLGLGIMIVHIMFVPYFFHAISANKSYSLKIVIILLFTLWVIFFYSLNSSLAIVYATGIFITIISLYNSNFLEDFDELDDNHPLRDFIGEKNILPLIIILFFSVCYIYYI